MVWHRFEQMRDIQHLWHIKRPFVTRKDTVNSKTMKIVCILAIAVILAETGVSPEPLISDLINDITPDQRTNQIVDKVVADIHSIVDDTIAKVKADLSTTQVKIAGFYQTAGSLKGDLDKAYSAETAEVAKCNARTETKVNAAIVQVKAKIQDGIAQVEEIAKSKNVSPSIIDDVKSRVHAIVDRAVAAIDKIVQCEFENTSDELSKSHSRQNTLRTLAANCGTPAECASFDLLWKKELQRCADQLKELLDEAACDIQWEIQVAVTEVKAAISPIGAALHYIVNTVVSGVIGIL